MEKITEDAGNAVKDLLQEYVVVPVSEEMQKNLSDTADGIEKIETRLEDDIKMQRSIVERLERQQKKMQKELQGGIEDILSETCSLKGIKQSCGRSEQLCKDIKSACEQLKANTQNMCKKMETNSHTSNKLKDSTKAIFEKVCGIDESQKRQLQDVQDNITKNQEELCKNVQSLIEGFKEEIDFDKVQERLDELKQQNTQEWNKLGEAISERKIKEENYQNSVQNSLQQIQKDFETFSNKMQKQNNSIDTSLEKKYSTLLRITLLLGGMDLIGVIASIVMQLM